MRREFPSSVKEQAYKRSNGNCEQCTRKLGPGDVFYDHVIADGLGGPPELKNCAVLCRSCHDTKTRTSDVPLIAKGRRVRRRHIGIRKRGSFATNRDGPFRKRMDGTVERRRRS